VSNQKAAQIKIYATAVAGKTN